MSKERVHTQIPQNLQSNSQTYGNVDHKVVVSDYTPDDSPKQNILFTTGLGKGGGGDDPGGRINGTVMTVDTYAKFVDIVSEGEIEGPVNGYNSVLLNGTPLTDSNGNLNFSGVQVYPFYGTPDQKFPPMFQKSGVTYLVNAEIKKTQSYTFTISDSSITSVNVIIKTPLLSSTDDKGNVNGTSVAFTISVNGQTKVSQSISGIALSPFEKGFIVNLRDFTGDKTIVVSRITGDSTDPKLQNKTFVNSYTTIIDYTLNYANRAGCALTFEAAQFGTQLPDRSYHVKGRNTINIPENYDPIKRTYTGAWNGVFKQAYTNNPVWCLYDILTNKRYGAGDYIDASKFNKFQLYDLAVYCDEQVPGLDGNLEPRFTFNAIITDREQVLSLILKMQASFFSMIFYTTGIISIAQDKDADPVALVTNANVIDGYFDYSSSEYDKQTNTVVVSYNDSSNSNKVTTETVYNNRLLELSGREVKKKIYALGCTSRSEANRRGKYILLSDALNAESVSYTAGLDHAQVVIGDVVEIHDNFLENTHAAGRLISMKDTTIVLDRSVTFISGIAYKIKIIDQSGDLEELDISPAVIGNVSTITVVDNKGFTSSAYAIFAISIVSDTTKKGSLYRIISIKENDDNKYDILANKYDPNKYNELYSPSPIDDVPENNLTALKAPPYLTKSAQSLYKDGKTIFNQVTFSWQKVSGASHYEYQYRIDSGQFTQMTRTTESQFQVLDKSGVYEVKVRSADLLNRNSSFISLTLRIDPNQVIPENVENFTVHRSGSSLQFSWDNVPLAENGLIEYYEVRSGTVWEQAVRIFRTGTNSHTYTLNTGGTFLIKAFTVAGVPSAVAASTIAIPGDSNLYITDDYAATGFPHATGAQLINFVVDTSTTPDRLQLIEQSYGAWEDSTDLWSTYTKKWADQVIIGLIGVYETDVKDIGAIEDVFIKADVGKLVTPVDLYAPDFDTLYATDLDNGWYAPGKEDAGIVSLSMRYSDDNVTFTDYKQFVPGQYRARYFQYLLTLRSDVMKYLMYIDAFKIEYDIPDARERALVTTGPGGLVTYTFTKKYHNINVLSVVGNPTSAALNLIVKTVAKSLTQATFLATTLPNSTPAVGVQINVLIQGY